MRRACIDIGSNTTRLLVADGTGRQLVEVDQQRAFTHLRRGLQANGRIATAVVAELVCVVQDQLARARALGAAEVAVVGTAAVRQAANGDELARALARLCGVELRILTEEEEARLAFLGACGALAQAGAEASPSLGLADVGGGSSELVVGAFPDRVGWCRSLSLGSGVLADACFHSDPPAQEELDRARAAVAAALEGIDVPHPERAVAVGGSAASVRRLAGDQLDASVCTAALERLQEAPAAALAARFGLEVERVRLLPAGVVILQSVQERFGVPLDLVGGGLREGVLLELERG